MRLIRPLAFASTILAGVATAVVAASAAPLTEPTTLAPLAAAAPGKAVPGSYIVTVRNGVSGRALATSHAVTPETVYTSVVDGFAAKLTPAQLAAVRADKDVAAVEANQVFHADSTQTVGTGTWGLDRLDQRRLPLSKTYTYTAQGAGVTAYVIDTGLQRNHPQFGTRASWAYDYFGGIGDDCNGHGTHVAGIIGGSTYGVAKAVKLRGVRVLDCSGGGSTASVIAGVDYVRLHRSGPSVANLSLSGPKSTTLDAAVKKLVDSGVAVAVAAGNDALSACGRSPAGASGVLTVAALDKTDHHASFSNYGSCVEVYAPGVSVQSAWIGGTTATLSGTSMASPHTAGVLALRMTNGTNSASAARSWILSTATAGIVVGEPSGTPDRVLYKSTL